jgi:hypothetical protein
VVTRTWKKTSVPCCRFEHFLPFRLEDLFLAQFDGLLRFAAAEEISPGFRIRFIVENGRMSRVRDEVGRVFWARS